MTSIPDWTVAEVLDCFRVTDRVSIVTGAGRGIGAASALTLAAAGSDIALVARRLDDLEAVATQVRALGRRALVVPADLDDTANAQLVVERTIETFGRIDIVVNNVGGTTPRPLMDTTEEYLEHAFHFDVVTGFALTRHAVPTLLRSDGASVVNISSAMAHNPDRGMAAAGTAKAALNYLTTLMAADLAPTIRVNAVAPGSIETPALLAHYSPEGLQAKLARTPLRRLGRSQDIALAVLFLASRASSFMTGKVLEVDGGVEAPNSPSTLPDLTT